MSALIKRLVKDLAKEIRSSFGAISKQRRPARETNKYNKNQLYRRIKEEMSLRIPRASVCPGHDAPFDYVWEGYSQSVRNCIVIANRNGGKTINSAALEFCEATDTPGLEIAHLGAIMAQAKRAYKYVRSWSLKYAQTTDSKREETSFSNGSTIEIIPGTITGVNSPHPHKACIDEFELMAWDIFEEAGSMPKSSGGILSALRLVTTRKKNSGNAQKMLDEAQERGFRVYKWCIFEVMTPCEHQDCVDCEYKDHATYTREGNRVTWPEICQGKAKEADGYYPLEDVVANFKLLSWEMFDAQWLCNRPERYDAVFLEFSEIRNVLDDWEIKTEDGWRLGRGWDYGYNDPTAVIWFNYNPSLGTIVAFAEEIVSGKLIQEIGEDVRDFSSQYAPPRDWQDWGDPSGKAHTGVSSQSYVSILEDYGIWVDSKSAKVIDGIMAVKEKLKVSSFTGSPNFFVVRGKVPKLQEALESARWDRVETATNSFSREKYYHDEYSHPLDALRYFVTGEFPIECDRLEFG